MQRPARASPDEVGHDPTVVQPEPRSIDVEGPHDRDRQAVEPVVGHAERLREPLRLVVARARADARDVAPVVLGRRDTLGRRIAVDLARAEEQEARDALPARQVEQPACPADVHVDRLERPLAVPRRRCDARAVDDVRRAARRARAARSRRARRARSRRGLSRCARRAESAVLRLSTQMTRQRGDRPRSFACEQCVHEVARKEAFAAGDEHGLAGEPRERHSGVAADLVEVATDRRRRAPRRPSASCARYRRSSATSRRISSVGPRCPPSGTSSRARDRVRACSARSAGIAEHAPRARLQALDARLVDQPPRTVHDLAERRAVDPDRPASRRPSPRPR